MGEQLEIPFEKDITEDAHEEFAGKFVWKMGDLKITPVKVYPIVFMDADGVWLMRLTEDKRIQFNRDAYPNLPIDHFAERVMNILEMMVFKHYPQTNDAQPDYETQYKVRNIQ